MSFAFLSKNKTSLQNPYLIYGLLFLLITLVSAIILLAFVPPISRDALTHHLYIPRFYLEHGGIYEIPDLIFSYYPMNLDLLYMAAMYLGSDILPKYIHMFFGLATGYLIYRFLKPRLPFHYALLGALCFLSIPIIVKLSITVYVDLGLVFFTTASLLLLFHWIEKEFQVRYLVFAGLCCGFAIGTKYNGLIVFFLLTLFVPFLYLRNQTSEQKKTAPAIKAALLFFLCALLAVSPWFIRNMLWTGNPVYPLYNGFFNPKTITDAILSSDETTIRGVFATRYALYGENIWQLLSLPVRIFFEGVDDNPRYFDGRLNPFLLMLPFFAFLRSATSDKKRQIEKFSLLVFCLLYFLFAFNSGVLRIRYLVPIIPFLVILAMFGLHNIELQINKLLTKPYLQTIFWLVPIIVMLSYNGRYIYQQFVYVDPISYITGKLSRDEYITRYRPEYKVMQYANTQTPDTAKILCVFMGQRGYYLKRSHIFEDSNNNQWLLSWFRKPGISSSEIARRLKQQGITHIILRTDLFALRLQQTIPKDNQHLPNELFSQNLILLTSHLNYSLYRIKN